LAGKESDFNFQNCGMQRDRLCHSFVHPIRRKTVVAAESIQLWAQSSFPWDLKGA